LAWLREQASQVGDASDAVGSREGLDVPGEDWGLGVGSWQAGRLGAGRLQPTVTSSQPASG
jgi:hypothetical protein